MWLRKKCCKFVTKILSLTLYTQSLENCFLSCNNCEEYCEYNLVVSEQYQFVCCLISATFMNIYQTDIWTTSIGMAWYLNNIISSFGVKRNALILRCTSFYLDSVMFHITSTTPNLISSTFPFRFRRKRQSRKREERERAYKKIFQEVSTPSNKRREERE